MNIPSPTTYGITTLRSNFAGGAQSDPWSDYGLGADGDAGSSGDVNLQQYYQYRAMALQALSNGSLSPQEKTSWQQYLAQLDQWLSQYQGGNPAMGQEGWDPLNGNVGNDGPIPDYQDLNQMVFENGGQFSYEVDKKETREVHLYQTTTDVVIPSNAATANVTVEADSRMPGKNMAVVTVTFTDGTTRKIYVHNIDRKDAKVNVRAASEDQITLDASTTAFADKIKASGLQDIPEEEAPGTPPDKTEEGQRIWNKNDMVDYYVTEGSEIDKIYADEVNITLPDRSHRALVSKTGEHEYEITIKNEEGDTVRKIRTYQTDRINFNGIDADNLFYQIGSGDNYKSWTENPNPDPQISLGSAGGDVEPEVEGNPLDTQPDKVDGKKAIYNNSQDVEIHADYEGAVDTHEITAPGTVTLHGASYADKAKIVSYNKDTHEWVIEFYKDGDPNKKETFTVHGGPNTKVILDVMDESKVEGNTEGVQIGLEGEPTSGVDTTGDTEPDEKDGNIWRYKGWNGEDVTLHPTEGLGYDINVTGEVEIKLTQGQTADVKKADSTHYVVIVKDAEGNEINILINKKATSINIEAPESAVEVDANAVSDKLKVGGNPSAGTQNALGDSAIILRDTDPSKSEFSAYDDSTTNWAIPTARAVGNALESGDWSAVHSRLNMISNYEAGLKDNYAQALFLALRGALGGNVVKLKAVIAQMPSEVKSKWTGLLGADPSYTNATSEVSSTYIKGTWNSDIVGGWTHQDSIDIINSAASSSDDE